MSDSSNEKVGKFGGMGRMFTLSMSKSEDNALTRTSTIMSIKGKIKMRGKEDDDPQDWWFASTAIPLLAATIGPLANVLSIAALVSKWRVTLPNNGELPEGSDAFGVDIPDPHWEIVLNAISLGLGFFGNFCLLLNFTKRIRYIVALPATIISWYVATGILIGIIAAMLEHFPPDRPSETWSQGFWHAIIAAVLYLIGSMILMINMLGYFLGHYPQHFDLEDDQRTLILQTMMFFFWLAGGAGVFSRSAGLSYADALYFCDVTVLTVGFGDIIPPNDTSRGIVFPYSVIGIIFLGLMINSIRKFASGMSKDKVVRKHQLKEREQTFGRTVTSEKELRDRLGLPPKEDGDDLGTRRKSITTGKDGKPRNSLDAYGRFDVHGRTITFRENKGKHAGGRGGAGRTRTPLSRDAKMQAKKDGKGASQQRTNRREKLIMLKEEKDRFEAMREIQSHTNKFKQYYALAMSAFAFGILWCVGAMVFYFAEKRIQDMTYFQALYFCYVSLLTIGYGDLSPKSNAGKPFFVVWSLVAIPTMTILISDMGDTVISAINRGTFTLADWTIMPKAGVWKDFLDQNPKLAKFLAEQTLKRQAKKRVDTGFTLQDPDDDVEALPGLEEPCEQEPKTHTLEKLAEEPPEVTEHELARKLAIAIKRTANDLRSEHPKKYSYEEWVEFTRLIRFSGNRDVKEVLDEEEDEGLIEWDWIGEDSPMLADVTEAEWVLDRLCESLNRYTRKQAREMRKRSAVEKKANKLKLSHSESEISHLAEKYESGHEPFEEEDEDEIEIAPTHAIDHYPAHPGPRMGLAKRMSSKSTVLSMTESGDIVVKRVKRVKVVSHNSDPNVGGSGSGETTVTTSTSSTPPEGQSNTNLKAEEEIQPIEMTAASSSTSGEETKPREERGEESRTKKGKGIDWRDPNLLFGRKKGK